MSNLATEIKEYFEWVLQIERALNEADETDEPAVAPRRGRSTGLSDESHNAALALAQHHYNKKANKEREAAEAADPALKEKNKGKPFLPVLPDQEHRGHEETIARELMGDQESPGMVRRHAEKLGRKLGLSDDDVEELISYFFGGSGGARSKRRPMLSMIRSYGHQALTDPNSITSSSISNLVKRNLRQAAMTALGGRKRRRREGGIEASGSGEGNAYTSPEETYIRPEVEKASKSHLQQPHRIAQFNELHGELKQAIENYIKNDLPNAGKQRNHTVYKTDPETGEPVMEPVIDKKTGQPKMQPVINQQTGQPEVDQTGQPVMEPVMDKVVLRSAPGNYVADPNMVRKILNHYLFGRNAGTDDEALEVNHEARLTPSELLDHLAQTHQQDEYTPNEFETYFPTKIVRAQKGRAVGEENPRARQTNLDRISGTIARFNNFVSDLHPEAAKALEKLATKRGGYDSVLRSSKVKTVKTKKEKPEETPQHQQEQPQEPQEPNPQEDPRGYAAFKRATGAWKTAKEYSLPSRYAKTVGKAEKKLNVVRGNEKLPTAQIQPQEQPQVSPETAQRQSRSTGKAVAARQDIEKQLGQVAQTQQQSEQPQVSPASKGTARAAGKLQQLRQPKAKQPQPQQLGQQEEPEHPEPAPESEHDAPRTPGLESVNFATRLFGSGYTNIIEATSYTGSLIKSRG